MQSNIMRCGSPRLKPSSLRGAGFHLWLAAIFVSWLQTVLIRSPTPALMRPFFSRSCIAIIRLQKKVCVGTSITLSSHTKPSFVPQSAPYDVAASGIRSSTSSPILKS